MMMMFTRSIWFSHSYWPMKERGTGIRVDKPVDSVRPEIYSEVRFALELFFFVEAGAEIVKSGLKTKLGLDAVVDCP